MRSTTLSPVGVVLSVAGVAAALAFAVRSSGPDYLTRAELLASRGAGEMAKKCSYSCNAYNQYINLCPNADMSPCVVCNKGTNSVDYADMVNGCEGENWMPSKTQTQDCGVQQNGSCNAIGNCVVSSTTTDNCKDPATVVKQGSE